MLWTFEILDQRLVFEATHQPKVNGQQQPFELLLEQIIMQ